MLSAIGAVAARESLDAWRDRRALLSAALYSLMGPGVVGLVSLGVPNAPAVTIAMMSVFTMVSAFAGGMNIAMDCIAGERERRSLLPLLLHPVARLDLLVGKWLAVAAFSFAGLMLNLAGFVVVFHRVPHAEVAACLIPLALLAAALQIAVSTLCRGIKEAQTYLSMLVFLPMGLGMFMLFSPVARADGWKWVPVCGQQLELQIAMQGGQLDYLALCFLAFGTLLLAGVVLLAAAKRLERDDVVYGG